MQKIKLLSLALTNFKGIRNLLVEFGDVTDVFGDNATGKTTLFDAFLWLLFGKDSSDRKDFEIKTLDKNNTPLRKLDHEVSGVLQVNDQKIVLRRVFREKWVTKRGTIGEQFSGHETAYFWNDVPVKQEEYQAKIGEIVNENIFKLITNTNYFNSLKWQDRRAVLIQLAGAIDDDYVLDLITDEDNKHIVAQIASALNQRKTIDEYKREVVAKKKKIKDELLLLPSRIDEANRSLPEEKDYAAIEASIQQLAGDLANTEGLLNSKSAAAKQREQETLQLIDQRSGLNQKMKAIELSVQQELSQGVRELEARIKNEKANLRSWTDDLQRSRNDYDRLMKIKSAREAERTQLRSEYAQIDAEKFKPSENEFECPTCKRAFDDTVIAEKKDNLEKNFNKTKSDKLAALSERGKSISTEIDRLTADLLNLDTSNKQVEERIKKLTDEILELETRYKSLPDNNPEQVKGALASNEEYIDLAEQVRQITEKIDAPGQPENNSTLLTRKQEIQSEIDELKKELNTKELREKQLKRIEELCGQEKAMAQELASYEGIEFVVDRFISEKMNALEQRINGMFGFVRFKMFEDQINGGRAETCVALINGIPYPDANTAAKIQAGLDIINVLCNHYGVQAPVWVDNRESVVSLPETDCQLINLIVSAGDKQLRINTAQLEAVA